MISIIQRIKNPKIFTNNELDNISFLLYFNSIENLNTASCISSEKIGKSKLVVVETRSAIPNSFVDKKDVYKGTNKNTKIFGKKLLIENNNIFFIRYFPLLFIIYSSFLMLL